MRMCVHICSVCVLGCVIFGHLWGKILSRFEGPGHIHTIMRCFLSFKLKTNLITSNWNKSDSKFTFRLTWGLWGITGNINEAFYHITRGWYGKSVELIYPVCPRVQLLTNLSPHCLCGSLFLYLAVPAKQSVRFTMVSWLHNCWTC